MADLIELALADIVGEYEQSIIGERSGSPEYKSWERRSIVKITTALDMDAERLQALNAELLAALKATGMHLCMCEVFPAGSDLQCHVGEPSTFCVPCQTRAAIARAESQQ